MEKIEERETKLNFIKLLLIVLFFYNEYNFINTQGSEHPLLLFLFNIGKEFHYSSKYFLSSSIAFSLTINDSSKFFNWVG